MNFDIDSVPGYCRRNEGERGERNLNPPIIVRWLLKIRLKMRYNNVWVNYSGRVKYRVSPIGA